MSKLDILYQFDNNYAAFAGISMTTLLENNKDVEELTVYAAAVGVAEENVRKLEALFTQYSRKLIFLNTQNIYQRLEQLGAGGWNGSLATWMKMFIMDEVPDSVQQLLYLDSDTLIPGSLLELAQLDLGEYPVAAVIDSISPRSSERLGLACPYCNAGVIYFNLKYWREHGIQQAMLAHLDKNIARYPVNDQDLLNDYFREGILHLEPKFNFQGIHFVYRDDAYFPILRWPAGRYYSPEQIARTRRDVRIIHFFRFCGEYPWQPGNVHPCKALYEAARDNSLWKEFRYRKKPVKMIYRLERLLYKLLPQKLFLRLHLKVSN